MERHRWTLRPAFAVHAIGGALAGWAVVALLAGNVTVGITFVGCAALLIAYCEFLSSNWLRRRRWVRRNVPWSETPTRWNR